MAIWVKVKDNLINLNEFNRIFKVEATSTYQAGIHLVSIQEPYGFQIKFDTEDQRDETFNLITRRLIGL